MFDDFDDTFQSTPPVKAATRRFQPRRDTRKFQSTPPVKAATCERQVAEHLRSFQSTPPVKAATSLAVGDAAAVNISIHAAREGGDAQEAADTRR